MTTKWMIALSILGASLWLLSPPRSYTVYIDAEPAGDPRFHLTTKSGRGGFHGRDVNRVDARFVRANQESRISLDADRTQWFGSLSVTLYHPEYFFEIVEVGGGPFRRSVTIEPVSWSAALSRSPKWRVESPPMGERTEAFHSARVAHQLLLLSDVHYHLRVLSTHYYELYARDGVDAALRRSIEEAVRIVPALESGLSEDSDFGSRNVAFHDAQLVEIHDAVESLRRRLAEAAE